MNTDLNTDGGLPRTLAARLAGIMEFLGVSPKKALEYLAMVAVLTVIYYCYIVSDAKENACPTDVTVSLGQLGVIMLKFLVFTGWPFALLAAGDAGWRSQDAGNVFLVAYIGANILFYHRTGCAYCIYAAAFRIIPYVFCAWVAHRLGTLRHRWRRVE